MKELTDEQLIERAVELVDILRTLGRSHTDHAFTCDGASIIFDAAADALESLSLRLSEAEKERDALKVSDLEAWRELVRLANVKRDDGDFVIHGVIEDGLAYERIEQVLDLEGVADPHHIAALDRAKEGR